MEGPRLVDTESVRLMRDIVKSGVNLQVKENARYAKYLSSDIFQQANLREFHASVNSRFKINSKFYEKIQ